MTPALYRIEFAPAATRDFRGLSPDVQRRLRPRIDALAVQPLPREAVALRGGEAIYRLRVGDYRILYEIREAVLLVLVVRIGHRPRVELEPVLSVAATGTKNAAPRSAGKKWR